MSLNTGGGSVAMRAWIEQKRHSKVTCAAAVTPNSWGGMGVSVSPRGREGERAEGKQV